MAVRITASFPCLLPPVKPWAFLWALVMFYETKKMARTCKISCGEYRPRKAAGISYGRCYINIWIVITAECCYTSQHFRNPSGTFMLFSWPMLKVKSIIVHQLVLTVVHDKGYKDCTPSWVHSNYFAKDQVVCPSSLIILTCDLRDTGSSCILMYSRIPKSMFGKKLYSAIHTSLKFPMYFSRICTKSTYINLIYECPL